MPSRNFLPSISNANTSQLLSTQILAHSNNDSSTSPLPSRKRSPKMELKSSKYMSSKQVNNKVQFTFRSSTGEQSQLMINRQKPKIKDVVTKFRNLQAISKDDKKLKHFQKTQRIFMDARGQKKEILAEGGVVRMFQDESA